MGYFEYGPSATKMHYLVKFDTQAHYLWASGFAAPGTPRPTRLSSNLVRSARCPVAIPSVFRGGNLFNSYGGWLLFFLGSPQSCSAKREVVSRCNVEQGAAGHSGNSR